MSDRQQLAEHGTGLCVAGLAAAGLTTAAAPLVPLAVLAAWGIDRYKSCARRRQRDTIDAIVKQIEKSNPGHRAVGPALALLKERRHQIAITPADLADADKRGNFPDALYDIVFKGIAVPTDDGVEPLLRMILTAAWQDLRMEDEFHILFVQESLTALEADLADGFSRIAAQLDRMEETGKATHDMVASLVDREKDRAREFGIKEGMLIALARKYAAGNPSDFESALRGLERALQVAAEEAARGKLPPNTDDAVNAVIARVDALNAEGDLDTAAALIADEESRAEAGLIRLYDKGIAQAILTRDAAAACAYELKKLPLDTPDPTAQFEALRSVRRTWLERGRDKGLNFDLEVSIALARANLSRAKGPDETGAAGNDLGIALATLGEREQGTGRLEQAVTAYRNALEEWIRDRVPLDWAMTQMNLGTALATLGEREPGTGRLEQAVTAYRNALEEWTRDRVPLQWAMTQMNLGSALLRLGEREPGTGRLEQAVTAYRNALEEYTRDRVPLDWAIVQFNLANVELAFFHKTQHTTHLDAALTHASAAREVFEQAQAGHYLAMADRNIARIKAAYPTP